MANYFKDLGVGVGLRAQHMQLFKRQPPASVSWVEVISENFMAWPGHLETDNRFVRNLEQVRQHLPVVLHGVSLSIGSTDPLNTEYLKSLAALAERIQPEWVSDHLCWASVGGRNLYDLLPLPYTEEALSLVVENIHKVQDFLKRRILIENPSSYLQFQHSEMGEQTFMAELARRADCGLLLDINNVYVSSRNHHFDPVAYLKEIPADRIGQIHLAGHADEGTYLVDTHGEAVCEEVWKLYAWALDYYGRQNPISVMLERDENIPEWNELEPELIRIKEIRNANKTTSSTAPNTIFSAVAATL